MVRQPSAFRRAGAWLGSSAGRAARFVALGFALAITAGACRPVQPGATRASPSAITPIPPVAGARWVVTPSVPRYEGCYVAFDAPPTAADAPSGTLVLALAADPASMGGFAAIEATVLDCAGANRGAVRDVGWSRVRTVVGSAVLDVASGAPVTVAEGPLAAGSWDRVFTAVPEAWGVAADGGRTSLEVHVEPIARGIVMPEGGRVTVVMQITTRARPVAWDGGWNLFTKDAWLLTDAP